MYGVAKGLPIIVRYRAGTLSTREGSTSTGHGLRRTQVLSTASHHGQDTEEEEGARPSRALEAPPVAAGCRLPVASVVVAETGAPLSSQHRCDHTTGVAVRRGTTAVGGLQAKLKGAPCSC